ncbi:GNAT family N-acetyltransferase [Klebsiella oxytoca]|uniref:GNAT family N-acetyltransferase n=1 Tax=Klebsiella oxytoca TaxID=571 RepID=A0A6B8MWN8_KLEOX|nr:GNAT family N-acetyltransferase [Klebsiella oxytoca]QGN39289.1 GNAT family N-acetyltransferase [Klebsiella oxytoca]
MEIFSKRCIIRPFNTDKIEPFMAYRNDAEWMQYQGFKNLTKEAYAEALLGNLSLATGMQLAIFDTIKRTLIGDIYLKQDNEALWLGYTVSPRHAGKGYAFEVATAVIEWSKKQGFSALKAGVAAENLRSINLLHKLGFSCSCTEEDELVFVLRLRSAD